MLWLVAMQAVGSSMPALLVAAPSPEGGTSRTSKHRKSASTHLKQCRNDSLSGTSVKIAPGRLGFPTSDTMRILGFTVPSNFFSPIAALSRARYKPREHTKRIPHAGLAVTDFKGRFPPSKAGGYTSVIAFKMPASGFVKEYYLRDQRVDTVCKAFDQFKDHTCS
jgi:hypothetical protein